MPRVRAEALPPPRTSRDVTVLAGGCPADPTRRMGLSMIVTTAWTASDWRDHFNERAAALEFDAGMDRLEAEAQAMAEVIAALRLTATNRTRTANRRDPD